MTKTYMVYYQTGDYGKAWFQAENIEEALDLISKVEEGELDFNELMTDIVVAGNEDGFHSLMEVS
jgi:hypothetical protein